MDTVRRQGWWVGGVLLLAACSRVAPAPEPFRITRVSPQLDAQSPRLLLNDSITVYFSADVLPVSVTSDSVTLLDERGLSIPGSLRVGANWVTFQPTPPVTAELNDGSFRPGGAYWLMVAGSPRPDAVRAAAQALADGVRVAGPYAALHLPWFPSLDPMDPAMRQHYLRRNRSTTWVSAPPGLAD